jgi:hypothetical protein
MNNRKYPLYLLTTVLVLAGLLLFVSTQHDGDKPTEITIAEHKFVFPEGMVKEPFFGFDKEPWMGSVSFSLSLSDFKPCLQKEEASCPFDSELTISLVSSFRGKISIPRREDAEKYLNTKFNREDIYNQQNKSFLRLFETRKLANYEKRLVSEELIEYVPTTEPSSTNSIVVNQGSPKTLILECSTNKSKLPNLICSNKFGILNGSVFVIYRNLYLQQTIHCTC